MAPPSATTPPATHAASVSHPAPTKPSIRPVVVKIPLPTMLAMTTPVAVARPMERRSSGRGRPAFAPLSIEGEIMGGRRSQLRLYRTCRARTCRARSPHPLQPAGGIEREQEFFPAAVHHEVVVCLEEVLHGLHRAGACVRKNRMSDRGVLHH